MIEPLQWFKRQTLIAPLGVKFWDVASGVYVSSGLSVRAYPDGDSLRATEARLNRSGTYVLHHASGLREFELGVGGGELTDSLPARRRFTVEVKDNERRFLPFAFEAELPCKGLFRWNAPAERAPLDPPGNLSVPLYSTMLHPAPAGMAALRAEIYEASTEEIDGVRSRRPAAWAMLEARNEGLLLGRGIADEQGRVQLIFAYPPPHDSHISSPLSPPGAFATGQPFLKQTWAIQLQAFYELVPQLSPPSPLTLSGEAGRALPLLNQLLHQQPANLFLDEEQTEPVMEVTLMYGSKVFVHPSSSNVGSPPDPTPLSTLFVRPAD
jgi:hypothetical protein